MGRYMSTLDILTSRERSAYSMIIDGNSYGTVAKEMGVTRSSVQVWVKRAKAKLYDKRYNIGVNDLNHSGGEIPLPAHAYRDPKTMENWPTVKQGGFLARVSWAVPPYNLEEWRIDASIVATTCSYCQKPLHPHWQGDAAWCELCGRWFDGYGVGRQEE